MRTRTDNSFMPRIGIAQIAIESKTCPSDSLNKIGNPSLRKLNDSFRKTKLYGNNWRVQDPGHLHIIKQ